jgi:RNA polymerase sigma-70 factor (ECF subfamily)
MKGGRGSDHLHLAVSGFAVIPAETSNAEEHHALDIGSLHAEHSEFAWITLQRLGIGDADVEDLLQEVFVVVHRRLHTFDGSSRVTTWLFAICLRVAAAHRRRAHVRRERLGDLPDPADQAASPEDIAATREAQARLGAILDRMDLEKRALFVMFEIDEVPCDAIGEILGVPIGTVYSRLHAARADFESARRRLEADERGRAARLRGGRP